MWPQVHAQMQRLTSKLLQDSFDLVGNSVSENQSFISRFSTNQQQLQQQQQQQQQQQEKK